MTDKKFHEIDEYTRAFLQAHVPEKGSPDRTAKINEIAIEMGYVGENPGRQLQNLLNRTRALSTGASEKLAKCFGITHIEMIQEGYRIVNRESGESFEPLNHKTITQIHPRTRKLLDMAQEILESSTEWASYLKKSIEMCADKIYGEKTEEPDDPPSLNHNSA
jgi:hypothetical protein